MTSLHHVIPAADRAAFLECRRAWDFSARERGDREPVPAEPVDAERAVRAALAVYYFPGMWDWSPAIVLPLVRRAYTESVATHRAEYLAAHGLADLPRDVAARAAERTELGRATLEAYLAWAPTVDEFAPVQVLAELDVQVPDPRTPDRDLADGARPVRYRDSADLLVTDEANSYWMVEHRFVDGPWPTPESVLRDDRCLSWCWAWERDYPGRRVRGTVYNELQVSGAAAGSAPRGPRSTVAQHRTIGASAGGAVEEYDLRIRLGDGFRRVQVPRAPTELAAFGQRVAAQLAEMIDVATPVYPNPSTARCGGCAFRAPCLAPDAGREIDELLARSFRRRDRDPKPGTLGARTWSMGRGAAPPT
jgi:hypothetical protein